MRYHFKVHKDDDSYWAEGLELPGCQTQADTKEELVGQLSDVLNLYLDEPAQKLTERLLLLTDDSGTPISFLITLQ